MAQNNDHVDDPFACFEEEDSEEQKSSIIEVSKDDARGVEAGDVVVRARDCGVLAFHAGTELSLLTHVENSLTKESYPTELEASDAVLRAIDRFCLERHWMMHVGPEKAAVLKSFLQECDDSRSKADGSFTLVELGTYCGYASIQLASTLRKLKRSFHITTIEVNPNNVKVATRMIQLAKLDNHITVLFRDLERDDQLGELLQKGSQLDHIDFLLLDHEKAAYLADLQILEKTLVRKGTYLAADNVIFHGIDSYRRYIQYLSERGVVETRLVEGELEYVGQDSTTRASSDDYRDGIANGLPQRPVYLSNILEDTFMQLGSVAKLPTVPSHK